MVQFTNCQNDTVVGFFIRNEEFLRLARFVADSPALPWWSQSSITKLVKTLDVIHEHAEELDKGYLNDLIDHRK